MPRSTKPIRDRLTKSMVIDQNGCWVWQLKKHNGYGKVTYLGRTHRAHRLMWQCDRGEIADGLVLNHKCRNRACINPDHLEPITNKENILAGICAAAINAKKTHCSRGHILAGRNVFYIGSRRGCAICKLMWKIEKIKEVDPVPGLMSCF